MGHITGAAGNKTRFFITGFSQYTLTKRSFCQIELSIDSIEHSYYYNDVKQKFRIFVQQGAGNGKVEFQSYCCLG
jgi:hypothetical protein